jgi:hypothetical protein
VLRRKSSPSPSERAALLARERVLEIRRAVDMVRRLRERRGSLTLAQIEQTRRLLANHAEELYRRADRVERGTAAPRLPRALALAALARRVEQAGYRDDPLTRLTCTRLAALAAAVDGKPVSPATLRSAAIELLDLADAAGGARYLPRWRPPPRHRGRHPNVVLDGLLRFAARRGITDAELADELERQQVQPEGPGSERPLRARWMAILKSARARRRRPTRTPP